MNKNDLFLGPEIEMIFSYPLQSLCFVGAGVLLVSGLALLLTKTTHDKWRNRAGALIFSGSIIAAPSIIPMFFAFIGSNILSYPIVHAALSLFYFIIPFIGAIAGYLAWIDADKEIDGK